MTLDPIQIDQTGARTVSRPFGRLVDALVGRRIAAHVSARDDAIRERNALERQLAAAQEEIARVANLRNLSERAGKEAASAVVSLRAANAELGRRLAAAIDGGPDCRRDPRPWAAVSADREQGLLRDIEQHKRHAEVFQQRARDAEAQLEALQKRLGV